MYDLYDKNVEILYQINKQNRRACNLSILHTFCSYRPIQKMHLRF
jgi:hypothetical protein